MMRRYSTIAVLALSLLVLAPISAVCHAEGESWDWSELPSLPDELGVAGPFAGTHGDVLIIAGGANFPLPVWETNKVWRDAIYVLTTSADGLVWQNAGELPRPLAYGAAVSTSDGVLCIGGNDAGKTYRDVFLLSWDKTQRRVVTTDFPPLPRPCAFGAATRIGDRVYVAGGQHGLGLSTAMKNFWMLDLGKRQDPHNFEWRELDAWPGKSRALNLTISQNNGTDDCVYVMSGRRQTGPSASEVEFLTDVWEYSLTTEQWRRRADSPKCVMAGTGAPFGKQQIIVLGGADGSLFFRGDELKDRHPGFPKQAWRFDTAADAWFNAGAIPQNHVTSIAVRWRDSIVVPTGEVRPRVRSPKVWQVKRK